MIKRHNTHKVKVGDYYIGGNADILVQSMTNTDTADAKATADQIMMLSDSGSEIVRVTVNNEESAAAIADIQNILLKNNYNTPIVGDFHYNGHKLLTEYEDCAKILAKYRINPGNVGFGEKRDKQFEIMIEKAIEFQKPVRIGVNWGSLDQDLATKMMDDNKNSKTPQSSQEVLREALVVSALTSAEKAVNIGLKEDQIIISCKVSQVQDLIAVYQELAKRSNYALHLGLTEAGIGSKGIVASTAALANLLQSGIGDTIRVSLTPTPGEARSKEVTICQEILQTMGLRSFKPLVISCPGCGRTTSSFFQKLAEDIQNFIEKEMPIWREKYPKSKDISIAVMGCIVNGPGESKHANIGISLPGTGESPAAPVFIDGKKTHTLRGENIAAEFEDIVRDYVVKTG